MNDLEKYELPKNNKIDNIITIIDSLTSFIPGMQALFKQILESPLDKRMKVWMNEVKNGLRELENKKISITDLENNEEFISLFVKLTKLSLENHQKEKIRGFRKVIVNFLNDDSTYNFDLSLLFSRYLNELSLNHFYLFSFLYLNESKINDFESYKMFYEFLLENSTLSISKEEFSILFNDLKNYKLTDFSIDIEEFDNGILNNNILVTSSPKEGKLFKITNLGQKFLIYIENN